MFLWSAPPLSFDRQSASGWLFIDAPRSLPSVLSRGHKRAESTGRKRTVKRSENCSAVPSELGACSDARRFDSWSNETIEFDRKRAANRSLASGCIECGRKAPQGDEQG